MKCYTCKARKSKAEFEATEKLMLEKLTDADTLASVEDYLGLVHCTDKDPEVYNDKGFTNTCMNCLRAACAKVVEKRR